MRENKTKMMALTALFTALTAVGAFIQIPIPPVPVTMQVFFVMMAGLILGPNWGALSQIVYLAIGLVGVPIFTKGGGIGYVLQPTFGYLLSFVAAAYVTGLIAQRAKRIEWKTCFLAGMAGLVLSLVIGTAYMYGIMNLYLGKPQTVWAALMAGMIPFLIGDTLLMAVDSLLSVKIIGILQKSNLYHGKEA